MRLSCILITLTFSLVFFSCSNEKNDTSLPTLSNSYIDHIQQKRIETNLEMKTSGNLPIEKDSLSQFKGLHYFEIDESWNLHTAYEKIDTSTIFDMPTSTDRVIPMIKDGRIRITKETDTLYLFAYRYVEHPEEDLFVPFLDLTNGDETYGGGRYIEVAHPLNDSVWVDFNTAYNPYCAYNHHYSCPIPPLENTLRIRVPVGEKVLYTY